MRICTKCNVEKSFGDFYSKGKGRRDSRCKDCQKDRPRGAVRDRMLKYKYGVTEDWYQEQLAAQGGLCASCGKPESAKSKTGETKLLAVDHDHETGVVRELLCQKCNTALGLLDDDEDVIEALLRYRRNH